RGPSEEPVANARHHVVARVAYPARNEPQEPPHHLPASANALEHVHHRRAAHEESAVGGEGHDAIGQSRAGGRGHTAPEALAVEGREPEARAIGFVGDGEAHGAMAKPAAAVVDHASVVGHISQSSCTRSVSAARAARASRTRPSTTSAAPGKLWTSPALCPTCMGKYSRFCCFAASA